MPTKNSPLFTNKDTRTWVQADGVGSVFALYGCHALTNWSRDFGEPTYVKCKSVDEYGKKTIKESIPGDPDEPTFTVEAYTTQDADFLLGIECEMDWQEFYGACSSPSDVAGYTKIRHFYRASKTSESESNIDFLGDEEYEGIVISVEFSCEDVVEVLKVTVTRQNNGVTDIQGFNDIAMLAEARCEGDCGAEIRACYWGVAVANASYGIDHASVWKTSDGGASWDIAAVDPFTENTANISSCVILAGETAPRIIVFRGNASPTYAARASITDDWGESWDEVDMGGNGSYINSAFKYSAGLIWCVGNIGYLWYSEDQGASWTIVTNVVSGTTVELWDIDSPDGVNFYAVGDDDTVIKSTDGGLSWSASAATPAAGTEDLLTVQALTKYRVFIGGNIDANDNVLWLSTDGGASWSDIDFTGSTTALGQVRRLRAAKKARLQHLVLIHGANNGAAGRYGPGTDFRFYRTLNGGGSWERLTLVANNGLNGLSVCSINLAWAAGEAVANISEIQRMAPG